MDTAPLRFSHCFTPGWRIPTEGLVTPQLLTCLLQVPQRYIEQLNNQVLIAPLLSTGHQLLISFKISLHVIWEGSEHLGSGYYPSSSPHSSSQCPHLQRLSFGHMKLQQLLKLPPWTSPQSTLQGGLLFYPAAHHATSPSTNATSPTKHPKYARVNWSCLPHIPWALSASSCVVVVSLKGHKSIEIHNLLSTVLSILGCIIKTWQKDNHPIMHGIIN